VRKREGRKGSRKEEKIDMHAWKEDERGKKVDKLEFSMNYGYFVFPSTVVQRYTSELNDRY